jgi:hypothetical protein
LLLLKLDFALAIWINPEPGRLSHRARMRALFDISPAVSAKKTAGLDDN